MNAWSPAPCPLQRTARLTSHLCICRGLVWSGPSLSVHEHRESLYEAGHQIVSNSMNFEVANAIRELICYVTVNC